MIRKPPTQTLLVGDCRETLKTLPEASVHCCVTSPPYWGLRDYGKANQIGLESTPEAYVAEMVAVFRQVRRVLRNDGVLWLNLGDSYAAGKQGQDSFGDASSGLNNGRSGVGNKTGERMITKQRKPPAGLKPKDLVGIPWRVAFALQADGWWLRQDIIWHKPNPMPESVTDRCTKAHEYLFLLAKSERYFYDNDAVRQPHARLWDETNGGSISTGRMLAAGGAMGGMDTHPKGYPLPNPNGRNRRSVWTVATRPYSGAHFATYPPELIEPCILAGTSAEGCCDQCGAPWERVVDGPAYEPPEGDRFVDESRGDKRRKLSGPEFNRVAAQRKTTHWQPTCDCPGSTPTRRPLVLDPFNGSGTTGDVARLAGCDYVGCELNPEYAALSRKRWGQATLL